jgi:predicted RNase H-like HicB family nuclease
MAVQIEFTVQTWREGNQYIAHAMPLDVASAGPTPAAARTALDEAVRLFLRTAEGHGTLAEVLEEAGYAPDGAEWRSPAWVGIERASATVGA